MDLQVAPLSAYIEAISDSDFAPLSFYKDFSTKEIEQIEKIRQSIAASGATSATMEGDRGAICCTADFESRLLVVQKITVTAEELFITVSDPNHEVEFNSRPISHKELDQAISRASSPCRKGEMFLGFGENTGVLHDLLAETFDDRGNLYPGSDRQLTAEQLAQVYGERGEHAALTRAVYDAAEDKAQLSYWQWLDSRLGQIDDRELEMLNAVEPGSVADLSRQLADLEEIFNQAGGRGVELAERIDQLRNEIAAFNIPPDERECTLRPSDRALTAEQLALRYRDAGEHPAFPLSDWRYEVANEDTSAGYWDWLSSRIELLTDEEVAEINGRLASAVDSYANEGPGF